MSECMLAGMEKHLEAPCALVVRGHDPVLQWWERLVALSRECGQAGALDNLEYYLGRPAFARKRPTLILTVCKGVNRPDRLESAVLLYEQLVCGVGSGFYSADFHGAVRTVICNEDARVRTAFSAGATLLQRGGAKLVHVSYEGEHRPVEPIGEKTPNWRTLTWTEFPRLFAYLPLEPTLDATLANLGKHTRRNLRYYRRRAEAELGVKFVEQVKMTLEDYLEANRSSLNPVADDAAIERFQSMERLKQPLFCGVQEPNGRWLSLIGGRRREGTAEVVWQINRAGLPRYSISTVMRAFLLEHEVKLGTAKLVFEGGTIHSIKYSFVQSPVIDLLMHSKGLRGWAVREVAKRTFQKQSFLHDALSNKELVWSDW